MNKDIFIDKSNGKLAEIVAFAKTHLNRASLKHCFNSLERLSNNNPEHYGSVIELHADWAPMSLAFVYPECREKHKYSGGIIFHGSIDNKPVQNLSITLDSSDGWQVHT